MANSPSFQWWDTIPWTLVIGGWLIVNWQHNCRETRKEVRSRVDAFKKLVDELEDSAVEHHTNSQDPMRCAKIKRSLVRISKELGLIATFLSTDGALRKLIRLKQAITLKNFESHRYAPVAPGDPLVAEIGSAADDLRFLVEQAYVAKFN
jgi:hypothetical protein